MNFHGGEIKTDIGRIALSSEHDSNRIPGAEPSHTQTTGYVWRDVNLPHLRLQIKWSELAHSKSDF
jgi:hypothetical protein